MDPKAEKPNARSKFVGWPGSITALRVDYAGRSTAFQALDRPENPDVAERKEELKNWKTGYRMDPLPKWDQSVATKHAKFPDRAKMRLLSEHQAVKIEHNFRAQQLPTCYKDSVYVSQKGRGGSHEVRFLSPKEKAKMIDRNIGTELSRTEFNDPVRYAGDQPWNISVELDKGRSDLNRPKAYPDFRAINRARHPPKDYASPEKTLKRSLRARETERRAARDAAEKVHQMPFTMSNRHEWLPPVSEHATDAPSRPDSRGSHTPTAGEYDMA
eukprot:TRINITY_DN18494_c0_g1_i1.p1 TRINITY_DN18494_c0_g1~~TRINITY_DN18494_c0_g1_i1.p1  ORF type:complete len:271 (+),score=96.79 TRINITY_DN18494_c0_g1_i1:98-910(+)